MNRYVGPVQCKELVKELSDIDWIILCDEKNFHFPWIESNQNKLKPDLKADEKPDARVEHRAVADLVAEERIVNMREQGEYHFYLKDKRNFKIVYGSEEFIESALTPKRFTLGHAYPNPFTNTARIPGLTSPVYS